MDAVLPDSRGPDNGDSSRTAEQADQDLRPSPQIRAALEGPLGPQGYQITDTNIRRSPGSAPHKVTLLRRQDEKYFLVGLSRDEARGSSPYGRVLVASFDLLFPKGSRLLLFSPSCDAMHLPLQRTIEAYDNIRAEFVPWLWIRPDAGQPKSAGELLDALNLKNPRKATLDMIGLDGEVPDPSPRRQLTGSDIDAAVTMFAGIMATSGDHDFFQDFVGRLDLTDLARTRARAQGGGSADFVARKLLTWADNQGTGTVTQVLAQLIAEGPGRHDAPVVLRILEACARPGNPAVETSRDLVKQAQGWN